MRFIRAAGDALGEIEEKLAIRRERAGSIPDPLAMGTFPCYPGIPRFRDGSGGFT